MMSRSLRGSLERWPITVCCLLALVCGPAVSWAQPLRHLVLVVTGQSAQQGRADGAAEVLIARLAGDGVESVGPEGLLRDYPEPASLRRCAVDIECLSRAASVLGADRVLLGLLSAQDDALGMTLELIDTTARRSLGRVAGKLPEAEFAARLLGLAEELLRRPASAGASPSTPGRAVPSPEVTRQRAAGEQALTQGDFERARELGQAALRAPGGDEPGVHALLVRACLGLLDGHQPRLGHLDEAARAARRGVELGGGATALQLQAELHRRFARVRLEPGVGWTGGAHLRVEALPDESGREPALVAQRLARELGERVHHPPLELLLPRPGRYRLNGLPLVVGPPGEPEPLVLRVDGRPPAPALPWLSVAVLGSAGTSLETVDGGIALAFYPWCGATLCLEARVEADLRLRSAVDPPRHARWLRGGLGAAWYPLAARLRLDLALEGLLEPASGEPGFALGGGAAWRVLGPLRLGLRPFCNFFAAAIDESALGAQLELSGEL